MSIPLVQNNEKDSINTSIIAIKRQIERINALLGLSNSEEIDTSVFATKTELEDAVTQVETDLAPVDEVTADNMQSVTSNAVSNSLSYSTTEQLTGGKWKDGKPIYRKVYDFTGQEVINNYVLENDASFIDTLITYSGCLIWKSTGNLLPFPWSVPQTYASLYRNTAQVKLLMQINLDAVATNLRFFIEYTKAS